MAEYRYPLELIASPFNIQLNPGAVYDHSDVYIYRTYPLPVTINITFEVTGLSYVEVYDGDNNRFLLGERVEINTSTTFAVEWDGTGTFQPRVWKNGNVTAISIAFQLPIEPIEGRVFAAGSTHNANMSISVSPAVMPCEAELFLSIDGGATKAATSSPIGFVSTGASQNVILPVTMPMVGGLYYTVYVDIFIEGLLFAGFEGTEGIIIPLVGTATITW